MPKKPPPVVSDATGVYVQLPPELADLARSVAPHVERARTLFGELLRVASEIAEESRAVQKTAKRIRPLPRARRRK